MSNDNKSPRVSVGVFIFNASGELLLMKAPRWNGKWVVPGGGVEAGESLNAAAEREVAEETGLQISDLEYLGHAEALALGDQYRKDSKHQILFDFRAGVPDRVEVSLNDEATEYAWHPLAAWLKEDLGSYTRSRIESLIAPKEDFEYKYKLALADYQNLLKRTAREKEEFARFAHEELLHGILPVYDNLRMSLQHAGDADASACIQGLKHVVKQFAAALKELGVAEIEAAGRPFDPAEMDALEEVDAETDSDRGKVARVVKAGYRLNGKVIMPAKVVVYKE